jgi:hypothetical protein
MPPWLYPSLLPAYAAALVFGYLCGSIPFGLILTRLAGTADIRAIGSGNIGATNVLRTGRKGLAAATLIGDALKGTLAVLLVYYYYGGEYRYFAHELALPAAAGAFLGHLFPVWLGFRGGKGVATYIGDRLLPDLARSRGADPLLLACRARCQRGDTVRPVAHGRSAGDGAVRVTHRAAVDHAPRQHRAPRQWQRGQDRRVFRRVTLGSSPTSRDTCELARPPIGRKGRSGR